MQTPNLFDVRVTLEKALFDCLREEPEIVVVQPGDRVRPDMGRIQVLHIVSPGDVQSGELGGRQGLCPRLGVYTVTLSVPPGNVPQLARAWQLSSKLEKAFYRAELPVGDNGCLVMCKEPYTTNVGETEGKRLSLSLSVPWWIWSGGLEGEE